MKMTFSQISCAAVIAFLPLATRAASASECVISGPRYGLTSDTVDWSIKIGSGQSCIRGLRFNNVAIEGVKLVSPPQAGQVTLIGPSFTYSAKSDYEGGERKFNYSHYGFNWKLGVGGTHFPRSQPRADYGIKTAIDLPSR